MPRIPIPRRGLRSLLVLVSVALFPYIVFRHLSSIESPLTTSTSAAYSYMAGTGDTAEPGTRGDYDAAPKQRGNDKASTKGRNAERDIPALVDQDHAWGSFGSQGSKQEESSKHTFLPNGLLVVNAQGQHPIYDLSSWATENWEKKAGAASKTFSQAVDEYRRRYSRAPPKGFDRWWAYAQKYSVQLPDEYDQIHQDLEPFWALSPSQLQNDHDLVAAMSGMYTISCPGRRPSETNKTCTAHINEDGLSQEGVRVARERAEGQIKLMRAVEADLEEVDVVMYAHDVPWMFVGHEYRSALEDAAAVREYYDPADHEFDFAHLGWPSACPPHKPLREDYDMDVLPDLEARYEAPKNFIWDHKASMMPCDHPSHTHLVGFLSAYGKGPAPTKDMLPALSMCKTFLHADVLSVSFEAWTEDVGDDPAWDDKADDRLLWRGKTTGTYYKDGLPWNISQRMNLVDHTTRLTGYLPVLDPTALSSPVGEARNNPYSLLNANLMDIGFTDSPIQCDPETCTEIAEKYKFTERKYWSQGNQYKYFLDLDGNGWSARFKRLMSTNSLVLKSTIFPEWYTDRIQPWVHYVPIKPDLTDLYDVMMFFREGNDGLAKEIATRGKEWSKTFWRQEDMVAYQFRLFLEYARLMAPDREEASYHKRGAELDA